jgi:hypothetical protein
MVRRREYAVSNHEAPMSASSFETPLARLLRMRGEAACWYLKHEVPEAKSRRDL